MAVASGELVSALDRSARAGEEKPLAVLTIGKDDSLEREDVDGDKAQFVLASQKTESSLRSSVLCRSYLLSSPLKDT